MAALRADYLVDYLVDLKEPSRADLSVVQWVDSSAVSLAVHSVDLSADLKVDQTAA